jgi:hypothetical protein
MGIEETLHVSRSVYVFCHFTAANAFPQCTMPNRALDLPDAAELVKHEI